MKLFGEHIGVQLNSQGQPAMVRWRLHLWRVASVEEQWRYNGQWWTTPATLRGRARRYYRVSCRPCGFEGDEVCLEIYREGQRWMLSRLLD